MTTKTQDLKAQLKALDKDDIEKAFANITLLATTVWGIVYAVKGKRAAKRDEWGRATYYTFLSFSSSTGVRRQIDEMRRKGFIK